MIKKELVSVIVPVYKVEKYLRACVDSLVNQTYKNIEIVLVDDKSPDGSGALCDELAKSDPRILVVHKEQNEGLNLARKTGFDASHGKYVTFLDSDDSFHKDAIKQALSVLFDTHTEVVVFGSHEFADKDEKNLDTTSDAKSEVKVLSTKEDIMKYAFHGEGNFPYVQYITVWGKLLSRKVVEAVDWNLANYRIYEDNFWTPQALLSASKVAITSRQLIYYRRNVAYGSNGENLGNRLTGNTVNGQPVGYLEFVDHVRDFYTKLTKENDMGSKLNSRTLRQLFLIKTSRLDSLAQADLLDSENNREFIEPFLREYLVAKNEHINNLDATIAHFNQTLEDRDATIDRLAKNLDELLGVKRSLKLVAGNIKRKITRTKN